MLLHVSLCLVSVASSARDLGCAFSSKNPSSSHTISETLRMFCMFWWCCTNAMPL